MENTDQAQRLYTKFLNNECSITEIDFLLEYFKTSSEAELLTLIHSELLVEDDALIISDAETSKLDEIFQRIKLTTHPKKTIPLYKRKIFAYLGAACIALIVGTIAVVLNLVPNMKDNGAMLSLSKHDIAPGKNTAVLILANGNTITLSDAKTGVMIDATKLTYSDGTVVRDPAINGRHPELVSGSRTIQTPRGGTYQVILSDGTHIWLNAGSTLKFPSTFAKHKTRKVELNGEAYFEVAKDKMHPFIVKSAEQEIEVLGTHFNVNAYTDERSTRTTLLEGSVKVSGKAGARFLKPNQQLSLSETDLSVKQVNAEDAVAWKNGYFMFDSENLESIMNRIARWYNVELVYENPELKKETFFGKVSKSENITKVLKMLEGTGVLRFDIQGRVIKIKRK